MKEPVVNWERDALRVEASLAAPVEKVQAYIADLRNLERWWPEHWRYRRIAGDGGAGTRYFWIFASPTGVLAGLTRIESLSPGSLAYRTSMAGVPVRMRYRFSPEGDGTRLEVEMRSVMLRVAFVARMVSGQLARGVERLSRTPF